MSPRCWGWSRWRTSGGPSAGRSSELDGHDMEAIVDALDALPEAPDKPSLLIAHTVKGKGTSFAEDSYLWHNNAVSDEVYEKAMDELGGPA